MTFVLFARQKQAQVHGCFDNREGAVGGTLV
jgi:hypothetical protein